MAEYGNNKQKAGVSGSNNETALMIEGLYNGIAFDLQKLKKELLNELKYASVQSGAVYQSIQQETKTAFEAMKASLDEACKQIKEETAAAIGAVNEETAASAAKNAEAATLMSCELKYGYQQNEMIFEALSSKLNDEVLVKLDSVEGKTEVLAEIDEAIKLIEEKIAELLSKPEPDYDAIAETVKEKVVDALPVPEYIDYDKITDSVTESVSEKAEASLATKSKEILDAVAAIPVPENLDYTRIIEEVSDKVLEKLNEYLPKEEKTVAPEFDYDRVIYGAAEKVVESLPYPEKVDYRRIEEGFAKEAEGLKVALDEEKIAEAVKKAVSEIDFDAIAEAVAAKIAVPEVAPQEIDYEQLSDMIVAKMPAPVEPEPIDYDKLAELVAAKITVPEAKEPTYEMLVDEDGVKAIAERVAEILDYDALAEKTAEKVTVSEPSYEMLLDEDGVNAIAEAVAEKLKGYCPIEEKAEEPVEETVEEVQEEPVEEIKEEVVEETVEEVKEEPVVEEVVEPAPAVDEIAVASTLAQDEEENPNELVDADTGLVLRLKKSFEAKLRQSSPEVKSYYSLVKNELVSYNRLNSNMSWHGDRFNFGRDTVARMNISGKTLCFYVALDPNDPAYKTTVYHQKDVSKQKAYENTPFMIKIKSETGAKKAARLVGILAEKIGAEKKAEYTPTDFAEVFGYASTKQLLDEGLIKVTKEKKVVLDFN